MLLSKFRDSIENLTFPLNELPNSLLLQEDQSLTIYYAPFDYINLSAKIVICGITPGLQQAQIALQNAQQQLSINAPLDVIYKSSKETASFAGSMRNNLIRMLNDIELHEHLGIHNCKELFSSRKDLVHYTSVLRYPVFKDGKNYSGSTPKILNSPLLRNVIEQYLGEELCQLPPDVLYIPLGDSVADVLYFMADNGYIERNQILAGMPHPSGANSERIAFFLGEKSEKSLSKKTNPAIILDKKHRLLNTLMSFKLKTNK